MDSLEHLIHKINSAGNARLELSLHAKRSKKSSDTKSSSGPTKGAVARVTDFSTKDEIMKRAPSNEVGLHSKSQVQSGNSIFFDFIKSQICEAKILPKCVGFAIYMILHFLVF